MWKCVGTFVVVFISQIFSGTATFPDARRYVTMPAIFHMDDFDRCMLYGREALYCMVEVRLQPGNPENPSEIWKTIKEYSSSSSNYHHDLLRHWLCIPDTFLSVPADSLGNTTSLQDRLVNYYNEKYKYAEMRSEIVKIHCETQESPYPIDIYDVLVGTFLIIYVAFVILVSLYGIYSERFTTANVENSYKSYLLAFSIPKNWRRLMTIDWENPDVRNLKCIQGVRFYNMLLVIMAHTLFLNLSNPVSNSRYVETITDNFFFMFFANGGYAVQTFFMISTWLLTYFFFVTFEGAKEIKTKFFLLAFINRYIRLVPTLAVIVALHSTWMIRLSRGPLWNMVVGEAHRDCRRTGWSNLLFINNYVGEDGRMCMPETWYVSNDTQFFIIGLFLLSIIWRYQKKISIILGSLLVVHISVIFHLVYSNKWESLVRPTPEGLYGLKLIQTEQWHASMISVWANIPGFVAGVAFGYIYYKYRATNFFDTRLKNVTWWIFIWGVGLGIIMIPGMMIFSPSFTYNPWYSAIYASTGRIIFITAIGVTILGMVQGNGKLMKKVCEWEPIYIAGRLTYSAYLIHTSIMRIQIGSRTSPVYLSDSTMFADVLCNFAMSYGLALVFTLLFEMPISELQKSFIPKAKERMIENPSEEKAHKNN